MSDPTTPSRLTHLDEASCRQLLASHDVGRVAINGEPGPEVLPVTYALRGGDVLFRTAEGVKRIAAERGIAATFEADGVDADRRSAWSVVARGHLEIADDAELDDLPEPLAGGDRPHLVRFVVRELSGRRIRPEEGWARAMTGRSWSGPDASDLMG